MPKEHPVLIVLKNDAKQVCETESNNKVSRKILHEITIFHLNGVLDSNTTRLEWPLASYTTVKETELLH